MLAGQDEQGVTEGLVSQIEKGTVFDTRVLKAYVEALGGRMHTTPEVGDELIRVASHDQRLRRQHLERLPQGRSGMRRPGAPVRAETC
ncbi:MAG TPA: hypothetical protein VFB06_34240 [Streptosporangiaceae bacterium]|nr:hypothetical protein [Streptosporangiaceae bacterium]